MEEPVFSARTRYSFLSNLLLVASATLFSSSLSAQCGVERWPVKTGTDSDAGLVNLTTATRTTIANLTQLQNPDPHHVLGNNRVQPTETTLWEVDAVLNAYAKESDSDYHLVIKDDAGRTMIAEIPDPGCVQGASPFSQGISNARSKFDSKFSATSRFRSADVPVRIRGVGMFDFIHSTPQRGVAPNAIELHPIVDIIFNPLLQTGDFSISVGSPAVSVGQGASGTVTVRTQGNDQFSATIVLAVDGLPSGTTANFGPTQIPSPGTGSSSLTISVGTGTPTGSYTLNLTGTADGLTHSNAITLNVANVGPSSSISIPSDGSTVSGVVNVTAVGGSAVAKMEIYIDGVLKAWDISASSVIYPWDTKATANGPHTITAKSYGSSGNSGPVTSVTVTVSN
jgi:Bacterial Ig domain